MESIAHSSIWFYSHHRIVSRLKKTKKANTKKPFLRLENEMWISRSHITFAIFIDIFFSLFCSFSCLKRSSLYLLFLLLYFLFFFSLLLTALPSVSAAVCYAQHHSRWLYERHEWRTKAPIHFRWREHKAKGEKKNKKIKMATNDGRTTLLQYYFQFFECHCCRLINSQERI